MRNNDFTVILLLKSIYNGQLILMFMKSNKVRSIGLATKSFRFFLIFRASLLIKITNINQLCIDHFVR